MCNVGSENSTIALVQIVKLNCIKGNLTRMVYIYVIRENNNCFWCMEGGIYSVSTRGSWSSTQWHGEWKTSPKWQQTQETGDPFCRSFLSYPHIRQVTLFNSCLKLAQCDSILTCYVNISSGYLGMYAHGSKILPKNPSTHKIHSTEIDDWYSNLLLAHAYHR